MAAPSRREQCRDRGSVPGAVLLVVLLVLTTALAAVAPGADRSTATAADVPRTATPDPLRVATGPVGAANAVSDDAAAAAAQVGSDTSTRTVARTMSMDAPIQGGLTAHQAQAVSARIRSSHGEAPVAAAGGSWTPAMGRTAVARARSWLGLPYSWAGGAAAGPTSGRCDAGSGADLDCHIVGFDCSGLMMYAWGAYTALPHFAQTQREAGEFHPTVARLRAGDLVFFAGYLAGGIGHVAIYEGDGMVIEAPQSGSVVRRSALADLMAHDGAYRGAVRPLTAATPTLDATQATAPRRGGVVTLRGSHLSGVSSLTLGTRVVRSVVRRTESTLTVRVPASPPTRHLAVSVGTSWGATSRPVTLTYAAPAKPKPAPTEPAPTEPAPSQPVPSKPVPSEPVPSEPVPSKPVPSKPVPSKPVPSKPVPTKPVPTKPAPTEPVPSTPTTPPAPAPSTPAD